MKTALLLAALASPAACWAQDAPLTSPTRDVDVTYRAQAGGADVQQRSRFAVSQGKIRIDSPSPGLWILVDREAHRMDMVSEGDRSVLEMRYDKSAGAVPPGAFTRLGTDAVAGVPCTEWRSDGGGHPVTFCLTADGVLLRARSGANVVIQATKVAYGPIPPAVFAIPADFQRREGRAR